MVDTASYAVEEMANYRGHLPELVAHVAEREGEERIINAMAAGMAKTVLYGIPAGVSRDVCRLLSQEAQNVPGNITISRADLHAPAGIFFFEDAIIAPPIDLPGMPGEWSITSLSWVESENREGQVGVGFIIWALPTFKQIENWLPTPLALCLWRDGDTLDERISQDVGNKFAVFSNFTLRVTAALFAFIGQKLVVGSKQFARAGSVRKAERAGTSSSSVVYILRRVHYENRDGQGRQLDHDHRWLVSGHWRQQWYPSEQTHKPKYINPYIKGPDNAPLIVKPRVISVSR